MFERILVAVDGSDTANKALVTATQMARDSGGRARLRLVHVVDDAVTLGGYVQHGGDMQTVMDTERQAGLQVLSDAMQIADSAGVPADTQLLERFGERLGDMMASAATHWRADLVVAGTHGRRGVGRVLLGSGAEQIVRSALVPVLVVRLSAPGDHAAH